MSCIYVLKSTVNGKLYTGSSRKDNPDDRLAAHNRGSTRTTKNGKPWKLLYVEMYNTYTEARKREIYLKSGKGRALLKQII
jgi:putative endonuclease